MNKASISVNRPPVSHRSYSEENLQGKSQQTLEPGFQEVSKGQNPNLAAKGFDLTQVPARPGLHPNKQKESCSKNGAPCSCPECSQRLREQSTKSKVDQSEAQLPSTKQDSSGKESAPLFQQPRQNSDAFNAKANTNEVSPESQFSDRQNTADHSKTPVARSAMIDKDERSQQEESLHQQSQAPFHTHDVTRDNSELRGPDALNENAEVVSDIHLQSMSDGQHENQKASDGSTNTTESEVGDSTQKGKGSNSQASNVILEDSEIRVSEGQMTKTEFLERLREAITTTIEPVLAEVGQTTEGCPYLNYWLELYHEKGARHIEQVIKKYAPSSKEATTAHEYISIVAQRARKAAAVWVKTGRITEVPDGVPINLPGEMVTGNNSKNDQKKSILFKAKDGGAKQIDDPHSIQDELGEGQALDPVVRSQMESAFGSSFSDVRTHTDSSGSNLSNRVNARAFTVGNHIAFGSGEYKPGTIEGDMLIAHELAHVYQQQNANMTEPSSYANADYRSLENDANITAAGITSLLWGGKSSVGVLSQNLLPRLTSGIRLQRCSKSNSSSTATPSTTRATTIRAVPQPPGSLAAAVGLTGTAATAGPNKLPFGLYSEFIGWQTDGRNGVIVQEITNTYNVAACPPHALAAGGAPTPHYWEAWHVDGTGKVTPIVGAVNDMWVRPSRPNTSGSWAMNASVFWAANLDPAANFAANSVPDAASLEATVTAPTNLGSAITTRTASGTWDCTGAHT